MRFAFYGRVSTEDQQDPTSSKQWQMSRAKAIIEPAGGLVVAEFFDIGQSRSLPWKRRPESASLLEAFKRPDRGFDAIVIGEPARAFYGNQFGLTFPVFVHYRGRAVGARDRRQGRPGLGHPRPRHEPLRRHVEG